MNANTISAATKSPLNYAMAHTHLGQAYIQKGTYPEAIDTLQRAIALSEQD